MTCNDMLECLIEADAAALAGRGSSDVAAHVRECARCRAVAQQLLRDTRLLATTVRRGAAVPRVRRVLVAPALAAAAVLAFMILPKQPTRAVPPVVVAPVVVAPVAVAPTAVAPSAVAPRAQVLKAFPPVAPVVAQRMVVAPGDDRFEHLAVTLAPGKRAAVMRTGDPAITVVWVY